MHIPPPKIRRRQKLKNLSQKAMKHQGILFLFSGGTSTAVSISIYWLMLNIVLNTTKHAELWFIKISAPTTSQIVGDMVGMVTNFLIQRYIVFPESRALTRKREQFIRYIPVTALIFGANYLLNTKIFIETLLMNPNYSRPLSAAMVAVGSFFLNKYFTFRVKNLEV